MRGSTSPPLSVHDLNHADSLVLADRQTRVLELLSSGAPLPAVLTAVTVALEELMPGSHCSVLLLDSERERLYHGAAPSLPRGYSAAIDGLRIASDAGSCGAAAYLDVSVVAEDIRSDPRWDRFRHLALPHGLHACWSSPIRGRQGVPVGTFAAYHTAPHLPTPREQRLVERFTHLASLAIDHAGLVGALVESEERFRRAFEDNAVGMALTDLQGRFRRVNAALADMLGRAEPELLGIELSGLVHPDDRAACRAALGDVIAERAPSAQFETRYHCPAGNTVVAVATASLVQDAAGAPVSLSINLLDITQRRAAQAERRARREAEVARTAAEAASRAKSEFLSTFSHELRTPLQAVTGFTELLGSLELSPDRREAALRHISEAAQHILSLVDDVLDIAKIEAGALPLHLKDVALEPLVGEVVDLLEPLATRRGIELRRGSPPGRARADPRRLRQILINLVNNAIRYNHGGGWVLLSAQTGGGEITVRVTDSGPGISAELAQRLFAPFDRLGAESGDEPGSGLGLALSRGLAEAMGGRLEAHNPPDAGTCVAVTLPAATG